MSERRVLRYEVPVDDQWHDLEIGHQVNVLHVAARRADVVEFWVLDHAPKIWRRFRVYGTGQPGVEGGSATAARPSPPAALWSGTCSRPTLPGVVRVADNPTRRDEQPQLPSNLGPETLQHNPDCSAITAGPTDAPTSLCGQPATRHVMVTEDGDNVLTCDPHVEMLVKVLDVIDSHKAEPICVMPGTVWDEVNKCCRIEGLDTSPDVLTAAIDIPVGEFA